MFTVCNTVAEMHTLRQSWRQDRVAFVPTMGNLHAGHLSLVEEAKRRGNRVVVSLYVNPTQFGVNEDFDSYPRTLNADIDQLKQANVDAVFAPTDQEMYPSGVPVQTKVVLPALSGILCGASRPGHFDGVGLVVSKLFNIVRPDIAVFGQKDFQQLAIIRQMVADLSFPIEIVGCPTARAADGLALSSRNQYLTVEEREVAVMLSQTLKDVATRSGEAGKFDAVWLEQAKQKLTEAGFQVDYLEARDAMTLLELSTETQEIVLLVAAFLGKTRLIDNLVFRLV